MANATPLPRILPGESATDDSGYSPEDYTHDWGEYEKTKNVNYDFFSNPNTAFRLTLGREPTFEERLMFSSLMKKDRSSALEWLSNYSMAYKRTPEYLRTKAPGYYDEVGKMFKDTFGREATQEELLHYGTGMAGEEYDPYELKYVLQQTPEFREKRDKEFRTGLVGELEDYDTDAFMKQKENVISDYAKRGMKHSPALDFALTNVMGDIARERSKFLTGVSYEQYGGRNDAARADYESNMNRYFGDQDYSRQRSDRLSDAYWGRANEVSDYNRQWQDYMNWMNSQKKKKGLGGALGPALGMGLGAALAAPTGGMSIPMGMYLGGMGGQAAGNAWDRFDY